jgi:hypothetical protein
MRIGVVGFGYWGEKLARACRANLPPLGGG